MEIVIWIGGGLFLIIGSLIAFVVARFVSNISDVKLELNSFRVEIVQELKAMNISLHTIDTDLRERIFGIDRRLIQVETEHRRRTINGNKDHGG